MKMHIGTDCEYFLSLRKAPEIPLDIVIKL